MEGNKNIFKNILVIVTGFLVLGLVFPNQQKIFYMIGGGVALISLLSDTLASGINWLWLKLALALGWINSRILLSLVYFVFLMPVALVSRLFTKDPLQLKGRQQDTVYTTRDHQFTPEDLENIW